MRRLLWFVLLIPLILTALPLAEASPANQFAGCAIPEEMPYAARFIIRDVYDLKFTVTVIGVGDFDPQMMLRDQNGTLIGCNNNKAAAGDVTLGLPTAQTAFNDKNTSMTVRFYAEENPDIKEPQDFEVIVTGANKTTGQFVLLYEGEYLDDGEDVDSFSFFSTPEQITQQIPLVLYALNTNRTDYNLQPQLDFAVGTDEEQSCQTASNSAVCGVNTVPLDGFWVSLAERGRFDFIASDPMLNIYPSAGGREYQIDIRSVGRLSYGPYLLMIQSGVAYPAGFTGRG